MGHDRPDHAIVDRIVAVAENVADVGDVAPRLLRIFRLDCMWDGSGGFGYAFKAPLDRCNQQQIRSELVLGLPCSEPFAKFDILDDVPARGRRWPCH
jgi:hypothetical protein